MARNLQSFSVDTKAKALPGHPTEAEALTQKAQTSAMPLDLTLIPITAQLLLLAHLTTYPKVEHPLVAVHS